MYFLSLKLESFKPYMLVFIGVFVLKSSFAQSVSVNAPEKSRLAFVQTIYDEYAGHPEKLYTVSNNGLHSEDSKVNASGTEPLSIRESLKTSLSANGGGLFNFHSKEDTKGSAYLFNDWMHGIVFENNGQSVIDTGLYFNYNKLNGDLIVTNDLVSGLTIDRNIIGGFVLLFPDNTVHVFTLLPSIDNRLYCEVIGIDRECAVLKTITTKFVKANFQTDGMTSSGNDYDEYVDTKSYYVLNLADYSVNKFDLKKKSVKSAFINIPQAYTYIDQHKNDELTDSFFKSLTESIK